LYLALRRRARHALRLREDGVRYRQSDPPATGARIAIEYHADADRPQVGREPPDVSTKTRNVARPTAPPAGAVPDERLDGIQQVPRAPTPRAPDGQPEQRARKRALLCLRDVMLRDAAKVEKLSSRPARRLAASNFARRPHKKLAKPYLYPTKALGIGARRRVSSEEVLGV